ncbi:hypothetical protein [Mycobacterium sp.]|uniref:hypothetical protein n=1 Tax=Mycobacterium sp. TaxID=1785 RepID=UPI001208DD1D|nr:hypothetical protein [Mycobacterium sp.]TAM64406.1 MAG: hypothetical protein EPN51_23175 [Mycobacterium sp.]
MSDISFRYAAGQNRRLRIAVDLGRDWVDLTACNRPNFTTVRIKASDLCAAQRETARIHRDASERSDHCDVTTVLVDLEAMTAEHFSAARAQLLSLGASDGVPDHSESLRYVGTPAGLAGLIGDIFVARVADGVTVRPLSSTTLRDFCEITLPRLRRFPLQIDATQLRLIYPRSAA